ncbi:MAG TPA: DNA polymerase III subunit beta [Herpetosiphonaceae bacterium]|nr:DNA polymerase III subunit beta [Herpetosiphonaceae bacterium]
MKLSCLQENLKRGIAIVSHAVPSKSTLPVLSNILMTSEGGRLRLQATNLEVGITCWIGAKIEEPGAVTVPAKLLSDFVGNLPNDTINLQLDERTQTIHLACGRSEANIKGIEADEFPTMPVVQADEPTLSIAPEVLREAINQVAFAAATDDTRPVLAGVLIRLQGDKAVFSATDGFRLSVRTVELPEPVRAAQEMIVPVRALIELGRIIGDNENPVEITVTPSGGQVLFHCDNVDLVSRLIDGKFPDYERIIPKQYATRSVLDRNSFLQSARQASVFATGSANIAKVALESGGDFGPGRLTLSANAAEVGDNKSEIEGQIAGEGGSIALNVKYLQEALNAIPTPQVALETQTPASPGVFRPVGMEGYIHIVMPMTVR